MPALKIASGWEDEAPNTCVGLFKDTTLVLIVGLFDLLAVVKAGFADPAWHGLSLHVVGTSLFVITFPLLLLGAHCLDLLDKRKPSTHTDPQEGV